MKYNAYHTKTNVRGGYAMKILVVVDMQNDFIDGSLGTKEAEAIVDNVVKKINSFNGDLIFVTRDTHFGNYLSTQEGKNLSVMHCVQDTKGWELNTKVAAALDKKEYVKYFDKKTFGSEELADTIYDLAIDNPLEVELIGLCTDICVVSNALLIKAKTPEIPVAVDSSCCAGVTPDTHAAALTTMKMCQIEVR